MTPVNSRTQFDDKIDKGVGDLNKLANKGWGLLAEEVSFPIAVLSKSAIENNIVWMNSFAEQAGVKLAPHGKTTMAPKLFNQQIDIGCWAISLATVPQVIATYHSGIKRIILANQLVGKRHFELIAELIKLGDFEFYCFVDSLENVQQLDKYFVEQKLKLNVLVEVGVQGGRCGCRSEQQVEQLCKKVSNLEAINLAGIAFYEGVIHENDAEQAIITFIDNINTLVHKLNDQGLFANQQAIVTGAGSAYYDLVVQGLANKLPTNISLVLRPGCYVIHDAGIYQQAQQKVIGRKNLAAEIDGELINSLEIWAYVLSIPESGLAIIGMGKRDVAFDAGLPTPSLHYSPNDVNFSRPIKANEQWQLVDIMDQHSMLKTPETAELKVGDLISFTTSHPCLTMDKWRKVALMADDYIVREVIDTHF